MRLQRLFRWWPFPPMDSLMGLIFLPAVLTVRIWESCFVVFLTVLAATRDVIAFDLERFALFIKPAAKECHKLARAATVTFERICSSVGLVYSIAHPSFPGSPAVAFVIGGPRRIASINILPAPWGSVSACNRGLSGNEGLPREPQPAPFETLASVSAAAGRSDSGFLREPELPSRPRLRSSRMYNWVDENAARVERFVSDGVRGAAENVAVTVGKLGDALTKKVVARSLKKWKIRCPQPPDAQLGAKSARRPLSLSTCIFEPEKAAETDRWLPYSRIRICFYCGVWRPVRRQGLSVQSYPASSLRPSSVSLSPRIISGSGASTTRTLDLDRQRSLLGPEQLLGDKPTVVFPFASESKSLLRSSSIGTSVPLEETHSCVRSAPIVSRHDSDAGTPAPVHPEAVDTSSGPWSTETAHGWGNRRTRSFASSCTDFGGAGSAVFGGRLTPLFPFIRVSLDETALVQTPPAQLTDGLFHWDLGFEVDCHHPEARVSLSVFDYDFIQESSEHLATVTVPAWRIPHEPTKGWLPVSVLSSSNGSTISTGSLWVQLEWSMCLIHPRAELVALMIPLAGGHQSSGLEDNSDKAKAHSELLPSFPFRRVGNSKRSTEFERQDVIAEFLFLILRFSESFWNATGTPLFRLGRNIMEWRYPLSSIATLISFWWVWVRPSLLLPIIAAVLGFTFLLKYASLVELWDVFPSPFSYTVHFLIRWAPGEDQQIREAPEVKPIPSPRSSYTTKMITKFLPNGAKGAMTQIVPIGMRLAGGLEKMALWSPNPKTYLLVGALSLMGGILMGAFTNRSDTSALQLSLRMVVASLAVAWLLLRLAVLALGTFLLLFWSKPVRGLVRWVHARRALWRINEARKGGGVVLLPSIDVQ